MKGMSGVLKAPFPYPGGKSRIGPLVWSAIGDVEHYIEPFFGSGAVLLARPTKPRVETVNDADGFVVNFWRAVKHDPDAVAEWAAYPKFECDIHARHWWLLQRRTELVERLEGDPDFFDPKIAGWWVWYVSSVICPSIGKITGPWKSIDGRLVACPVEGREDSSGIGIGRSIPHLLDPGQGVHSLGMRTRVKEVMRLLSDRLRFVRVTCGDWTRVCSPAVVKHFKPTAVFLDPPYQAGQWDDAVYSEASDPHLWESVRDWAIANANNPHLRIVVCGFDPDDQFPPEWRCVAWKRVGGRANQRKRGINRARFRERIWFSPHCPGGQLPLDLHGPASIGPP